MCPCGGPTYLLEDEDGAPFNPARVRCEGCDKLPTSCACSPLRTEFLRLLTEDSATRDRRRREYNQAIFATPELGGYAVWTSTTLAMVMDKFDTAVRQSGRAPADGEAT
jgi:hypothetical protein